jgi:hypothetical protein
MVFDNQPETQQKCKKKANQQQLAATAILTVHVLAQALLGSCHLLGRMPQLPTNEQVPDPNTFWFCLPKKIVIPGQLHR